MRVSARALAGGASALALIAAAPALAGTTQGHGDSQTAPTVDIPYSIDVSSIWGVSNSGTGAVTAQVDQPSNGALQLTANATGGDASIAVTVNNTLSILAQAASTGPTPSSTFVSGSDGSTTTGTNPAVSSSARAIVIQGIREVAAATGAASVSLTSTGPVTIGAIARANGGFQSGTAGYGAQAFITSGILQQANAGVAPPPATSNFAPFAASSPAATVSLTNSVDQTMAINADAASSGYGTATANINGGIKQSAVGTGGSPASATLINLGTLDIGATAQAPAEANATITNGISQSAQADTGAATVSLTNAGTLAISAKADQTAGSGGYGSANGANAQVNGGIVQLASAASGNVSTTFLNSGTLTIAASATAAGNGFGQTAVAHAFVTDAITQRADVAGVGNASASFTNSGTLGIGATAKTAGGFGNGGRATASVQSAVSQAAVAGTGDATTNFDNSGTLTVAAAATAASGGRDQAKAYVQSGVYQSASAANGNASNTLNNSSILSITASVKGLSAGYGATASATVSHAIYQTAIADNGGATNTLTNSGTITISADAKGNAAAGSGTSGDVRANANNYYAVSQESHAGPGDASVTLTNSGALTIGALANATSAASNNRALASASVYYGIYQSASGYGNATVSLTNDAGKTIDIAATANAADVNRATASASVEYAIRQFATAGSAAGDANATLTNNGTINILANATAKATNAGGSAGNAYASASNSTAVSQLAHAGYGNATVQLTNSGAITIGATAKALADNFASASASVSDAIGQYATADNGVTSVTLANNAGATIAIGALAQATGGYGAEASATVESAVYQRATGNAASVSLTNDGTLSINATAIAKSTAGGISIGYGGASAFASISETAIEQEARGNSSATVQLANSGTLKIGASADATSVRNARARAEISSPAIYQSAAASGGDALATLTNSGQLTISAQAVALGAADASGEATVDQGIIQEAFGFNRRFGIEATGTTAAPTHNASVALTNSSTGVVSIKANATATAEAGYANADASIRTGIYQSASATQGNASASLTNDGAITVSVAANALANAGLARATADLGFNSGYGNVGYGQIFQGVTGENATATLANAGTINILATANAKSPGAGAVTSAQGTAAIANATISGGIVQAAGAPVATAPIGTLAVADATNGFGNVTASLTNSGTIAIQARADATAQGSAATGDGAGGFGGARANAFVNNGIAQVASIQGQQQPTFNALAVGTSASAPDAVASVSLDNQAGATIDISAVANATADLDATALARVNSGLVQAAGYVQGILGGGGSGGYGSADARGSVSLTNEGTFNVTAVAKAVSAGSDAAATAEVGYGGGIFFGNGGVVQFVVARDANATLTNSGALNVIANASAVGGNGLHTVTTTSGTLFSGDDARASALVNTGVIQFAVGENSQSIDLTNSGNLTVAAQAKAVATLAAASSATAGAVAVVQGGVIQEGVASNSGTISLTNSGALSVTANALANSRYFARATATVGYGVYQVAFNSIGAENGAVAATGSALTLTNSGTLTVGAVAQASGSDAGAIARVRDGIGQLDQPVAADGTVSLTNSGTVAIGASANALAQGGSANAFATVGYGIVMSGRGVASDSAPGDVSLALDNSGTLTIQAIANATGEGGANARASGVTGISQTANAQGGGVASATLVNSGTISILDKAVAQGSAATANAGLNTGIYQRALTTTRTTQTTTPGTGTGTGSSTIVTTTQPGGNATLALTNSSSGVLSIGVAAGAKATAGSAVAQAFINTGIGQSATGDGTASASLDNSGKITIRADAAANAVAAPAFASASVDTGIYQGASGAGGSTVSLTSSGTISIVAVGAATGAAATANAFVRNGIYQFAGIPAETSGSGSANGDAVAAVAGAGASVSLTNSGSPLNVMAVATANATAAPAVAVAAINTGIGQFASSASGPASADLTNSGTITIAAMSKAIAPSTEVVARANVGYGIAQTAVGTEATVSLTNSGTITVLADANAQGGAQAVPVVVPTGTGTTTGAVAQTGVFAVANVGNGIYQAAKNAVTLTNSDTISIGATAKAAGGQFGTAAATVNAGVYQMSTEPSVSFTNSASGVFSVSAAADGSGTLASVGRANALGLAQIASGTDAVATLDNAGKYQVSANGVSGGGGVGTAEATAIGAVAAVTGGSGTVNFANSGTYTVQALAATNNAVGGSAQANALGFGAGVDTATLAATNSGTIAVVAQATGATSLANAAGAVVAGTADAADSLAGTLGNSGSILVSANAKGGNGEANALGIGLVSNANTMTLSNSGTINVSSVTQGGTSRAVGIFVGTTRDQFPGTIGQIIAGGGQPQARALAPDVFALAVAPGDPAFTINNDGGSIIARQSVDGGATFQHGTAIDTSGEPNGGFINLNGNGFIYGDVITTDNDTTTVSGGRITFDGKYNQSGARLGDFTIANGGTFFLVNQPVNNPAYDGPAQVNVNNFTVAPGGTIEFQIPLNSSGTPLNGQYPQVFANTATITGGTLTADLSLSNTLFPETIFVDNVIDANVLIGKFATTNITLTTPLLTSTAVYDNTDDVDLVIRRNPFNSVPGETRNQFSVASGIENVYDPNQTGDFRNVLAALFTLDGGQYFRALDQLSGASYAGYLQSLTGLASRYNMMLSSATDCPLTRVDDALPCRIEDGLKLWGQINYGRMNKDGDTNSGGYFGSQTYGTIGGDVKLGDAALLGASVGYVDNNLNFSRYNASIKTDGVAFGGYAVYDPGAFYLKGIASYTMLKGDSKRRVVIGSTVNGTAIGTVKGRALALTGEAGIRIPVGATNLTPYAAVEYDATKLKGLTETGLAGVDLNVDGGKQNRAASMLGLKWAGNIGGLVPELKVGWRHQFNSRQALVDASFADAPAGSDFSVISPVEKRDQALVGLNVEGKVGDHLYAKFGYQGRFAGDSKTHSGGISVIYRFGGK